MDLVEGIDVAKSRKLAKLVIAKNCHLRLRKLRDCETEDILENSDFEKMSFRK